MVICQMLCLFQMAFANARVTGGLSPLQHTAARLDIAPPVPYGRFSRVHVSNCLPDPGASNSCMHTFPETNVGLLWICCVFGCGI